MSGVIIIPMSDGYEVSMAADMAIFAGGDPRYPDKVHLIGIDSDWIKVDADWDEVKRIHGEAPSCQTTWIVCEDNLRHSESQ